MTYNLETMTTSSNEQPEPAFVTSWWEDLMKHSAKNTKDDPNYYAHQPETLRTESNLGSFILGNGEDIFTHIQRSIESAKTEVVLVTCFWAHSPSLEKIAESLRRLSNKVIESGGPKVRVFIGFSSLSIFQKLFQTSSLTGRTYEPSEWPTKLGLPYESELPGLDVQIKSIFVRPFSVMHPKFVIIDRKLAWLPSCNVSWESWFEGCVSLSGPVVQHFVDFWKRFWLREASSFANTNGHTQDTPWSQGSEASDVYSSSFGAAHCLIKFGGLSSVYTLFLPSPHRMNPDFRPWPWVKAHPPPSTPLNLFILSLLQECSSTIYMQTPNLTAPPVLTALLATLRRGINVHIVTSERLMILEQIGTAGTTTARCVKKLINRYKRLLFRPPVVDEEVGLQQTLGKLKIEYFKPNVDWKEGEPVQSHLKLTIVDEQWTVLGSGNMDRASWYTSQELGVAFHSMDMAREVRSMVDQQLIQRKKLVYDGTV
jgi:phosphatidylserine/phosphatidylglycerophosphate/cardiolipin synthase-like enzyme